MNQYINLIISSIFVLKTAFLSQFWAIFPFHTPLKRPENLFRGYKMGTLLRNKLIYQFCLVLTLKIFIILLFFAMTNAKKYCFRVKILFVSFIFGLLLFVSILVLLRKILSYCKKRTIVLSKITKMCL